jgi:murein DD-endopeptidase MepM/ murein hydrolase activator NlpD
MQGSVGRWMSRMAVAFGLCALATPWASAETAEPTVATPRPTSWQPTRRMKCTRVKHHPKWKMCDGPRRTPEPYGEEAFIGAELGMGTLAAAKQLLHEPPPAEWINAVEGSAKPTLLWPVENGHFGRGFGFVRKELKRKRHDGVDVGAKVGEYTRSLNDGIVAYSDNEVSGFGNVVMVVHKDGSMSLYAHQQANYVFAGQQVKRGQVLGEVGTTGISRGPHLHFEWHVRGQPRDPMSRIVGKPERHDPLTEPLNEDSFLM